MLLHVLIAVLLLFSGTAAKVTFTNSEIIDQRDFRLTQAVDMSCSVGCYIYCVSTGSAASFLTVQNKFTGTPVLRLIDFCNAVGSSGVLAFKTLDTGVNYQLVTTNSALDAFVVYTVKSTMASVQASTDVVSPKGSATYQRNFNSDRMTVLTTNDYVDYYGFQNTGGNSPAIYGTGYDAVGDSTCRPIYRAPSLSSASNSVIRVYSALSTVVFGGRSVGGMNSVKLSMLNAPPNFKGESSIVSMSPGYVGCLYITSTYFNNQNSMNVQAYYSQKATLHMTANLHLTASTADAVSVTINGATKSYQGIESLDHTYTGDSFNVKTTWTSHSSLDYYAMQFDLKPSGSSLAHSLASLTLILLCLSVG